MVYTSREEQEVIIRYDRELDEWRYYGDCPPLNRKWAPQVEADRKLTEENGNITLLEGKIIGNVIIQKKRILSDEQKKENAERLKKARFNS